MIDTETRKRGDRCVAAIFEIGITPNFIKFSSLSEQYWIRIRRFVLMVLKKMIDFY